MKAIKVYIAKPVDTDWPTLRKVLGDLAYQSAKALNYAMTQWYLWQCEHDAAKAENRPCDKIKKELQKEIYHALQAEFPEMGTSSLNQICQKARSRWHTDCKEVFYSLKKSLPSFKKSHPIILHQNQILPVKSPETVHKDPKSGRYTVTVSLLSQKAEGQRTFTLELFTKKIKGGQRAVLKRLATGEYKKRTAQISFDRKGKWYMVFFILPSISRPVPNIALIRPASVSPC